MAFTKTPDGTLVVDGQASVALYRWMILRSALKLEAVGLKVSRGPSALSIVKRELGFRGSREKVLAQLESFIDDCKLMRDAT
jgi:hypothetical protein